MANPLSVIGFALPLAVKSARRRTMTGPSNPI